jgi:pimeloyl-ACP methyl ester carboxylesterase
MGPAVMGLAAKGLAAMRAKWLPVLEARRAGTLDRNTLPLGDQRAIDGGIAVAALSLGAMLDYPPLEPAEIRAPTLWLVGSQDTTSLENVREYEKQLSGTPVTVQQIGSGGYSDSFFRVDAVLALVEPFLAKHTK